MAGATGHPTSSHPTVRTMGNSGTGSKVPRPDVSLWTAPRAAASASRRDRGHKSARRPVSAGVGTGAGGGSAAGAGGQRHGAGARPSSAGVRKVGRGSANGIRSILIGRKQIRREGRKKREGKKEEGRRKKPHRCHGRGNQTKLEPQRRPGRRPGAGHGQQAGGSPEGLDGAAAGRFAGAARTSRAGTDTTIRQTPTTSRARGPWAPCPVREDGQLNPTCGPSDGSICGRLSSLGNSESSRTRRHGGGEDPGPGPRVDGDAGVEDQPRPGPELDPEPATHPLRL